MQQKPVIGIIGCYREFEGEPTHVVKARYVTGVREFAQAVPVVLPGFAAPSDARDVLTRLDGVLLTGSVANVGPENYGGPINSRGPFDLHRDETTFALIEASRQLGVPLYGICRGLQEINVALGGTLRDQRDEARQEVAHHAPDGVSLDAMFAQSHDVDVAPGSTLEINSSPISTYAHDPSATNGNVRSPMILLLRSLSHAIGNARAVAASSFRIGSKSNSVMLVSLRLPRDSGQVCTSASFSSRASATAAEEAGF